VPIARGGTSILPQQRMIMRVVIATARRVMIVMMTKMISFIFIRIESQCHAVYGFP